MATEEPVLHRAAHGCGTQHSPALRRVWRSPASVATLGAAAALYSGPLALPELPGSELGPYVLVCL